MNLDHRGIYAAHLHPRKLQYRLEPENAQHGTSKCPTWNLKMPLMQRKISFQFLQFLGFRSPLVLCFFFQTFLWIRGSVLRHPKITKLPGPCFHLFLSENTRQERMAPSQAVLLIDRSLSESCEGLHLSPW